MSDNGQGFFEQFKHDVQRMRVEAPDIARGFGAFFQSLMKEGALSVREKELIALGIAMSLRCTPCINLHVQKCLHAGATREQILEAAGVVVVMQGGPGYTHVPDILHVLDELQPAGAGG